MTTANEHPILTHRVYQGGRWAIVDCPDDMTWRVQLFEARIDDYATTAFGEYWLADMFADEYGKNGWNDDEAA